jgi:epoxyqueuosine reductase
MIDSPTISRQELSTQIKLKARELGFDLVGIAPAHPSQYQDYFRQWLAQGRAGTMHYLHKRFEERTDPAMYLPGAQSVVCVAVNYYAPLEEPDQSKRGKVARYALGDDYHEVLKPKLHQLADWIHAAVPECQTKAAVDTAPLMEKELAARAGIGWLGKNTCIINPHIGSWLLLGEIITTAELEYDNPAADHCGTCTRCIDACPTAAITAPYQLDARKCISYLTIEHRDEIEPALGAAVGEWLYGCDVCQDVCPWNSKAVGTEAAEFQPRMPTGSLDVGEVLNWAPDDYRARLKGSAMKRVKLPVLQRNARIVAENLSKESR